MPAKGTTSHRTRSALRHTTARRGPQRLEWASEAQRQVFTHGPTPLCASGGFGAGKTAGLVYKALFISDRYPKNRGIIARRVWDELRKTTLATFFKLCPPEAYRYSGRRNDQEKIVELNNGSEILWLHLDDPDTENVIRGLEINWFLIDQAEEVDEEIFELMMGRLGRWDKTEVPPHVIQHYELTHHEPWPHRAPDGRPIPPTYPMLACNPDTELHWIYRRFHPDSPEHWDKKLPEIGPDAKPTGNFVSYHDLGYTLINMPSDENKFLTKQNLNYLLAKDETFVRRFVKGEWGIPEGVIHTPDPMSIVPATPELVEKLLRTCTLHRTLDHGDAAPTCCLWWAVDQAGNCFCYREYYMPNALVSDHRQNIFGLSTGERYTFQLADPSIFGTVRQKAGKRWFVSDEYCDVRSLPRETAIWWQPGDNNEMGTRNRIGEYLRVDPTRVNPITGSLGSPRLFFLQKSDSYPQGCYHAIRELRSQRRERLGTELGKPIFSDERDKRIADHAYDAIRYFIASRPPVGRATVGRTMSDRSFSRIHEQLVKFQKSGGFLRAARNAAKIGRLIR